MTVTLPCDLFGLQLLDKFSIGGINRPNRLVVPSVINGDLALPVAIAARRRQLQGEDQEEAAVIIDEEEEAALMAGLQELEEGGRLLQVGELV